MINQDRLAILKLGHELGIEADKLLDWAKEAASWLETLSGIVTPSELRAIEYPDVIEPLSDADFPAVIAAPAEPAAEATLAPGGKRRREWTPAQREAQSKRMQKVTAGRWPNSEARANEIRALYAEGVSKAEICRRLGVALSAVYRVLPADTSAEDRKAKIAAAWTPERRQAQAERIKQLRAEGKMPGGKSPLAARDVPAGEIWAFCDHATVAETVGTAPETEIEGVPEPNGALVIPEIATAAQGPSAPPREAEGADDRAADVEAPSGTRAPEKVEAEREAASFRPSSEGGRIPGADGSLAPHISSLPRANVAPASADSKFPTLSAPGIRRPDSIEDLIAWRTYCGDVVKKLGPDQWSINGRSPVDTVELVRRTNNLRRVDGGRPFDIALDASPALAEAS